MQKEEPPLLPRNVSAAPEARRRLRARFLVLGGVLIALVAAAKWSVARGLEHLREATGKNWIQKERAHVLTLTNRAELVETLLTWGRSTNAQEATPEARAAAGELSRFDHVWVYAMTNEQNGRISVGIRNIIPHQLEYVFVAEEGRDLPAKFRHSEEVATNVFLWKE
jgi:hypothetical protein